VPELVELIGIDQRPRRCAVKRPVGFHPTHTLYMTATPGKVAA
jgi:hypothetical protein